MAPPCKRYKKAYIWHIINIAEFATLGVAARAVTLENRGGKSLFSNIAYENDTFITQFSEENRRLHH
jgi:hypothetical protein